MVLVDDAADSVRTTMLVGLLLDPVVQVDGAHHAVHATSLSMDQALAAITEVHPLLEVSQFVFQRGIVTDSPPVLQVQLAVEWLESLPDGDHLFARLLGLSLKHVVYCMFIWRVVDWPVQLLHEELELL